VSSALWIAASLLVSVAAVASQTFASERAVDYLYVEANEDAASGGHVGVRLGAEVFHFQYHRPGLLLLHRDPFSDFVAEYAGRENRSIEVTRIPVDDAAYDRLHAAFTRRLAGQRRDLETAASLRSDRTILTELLNGRTVVEGAHVFATDRVGEPVLLALRERILSLRGDTFLADRRERYLARLKQLATDDLPATTYSFAQRYRDALSNTVALEMLDSARPLVPSALTAPGDVLTDEDAALVADLMATLADSLVRLVDSRRPDWGYAALLGLARLVALERSRELGRWVALDRRVWERTDMSVESRPEAVPRALRPLMERVHADGTFPEMEFNAFELALTRRRAAGGDPSMPAGAAYPLPGPAPSSLQARADDAVRDDERHRTAVNDGYRYRLITRNCVTELVRELDTALLALDPSRPIPFIPAASALAVRDRYGVSTTFEISSRRKAAVARLYDIENAARVFLRESNALTSTIYRRNERDSIFIFFTDDTVAVRPMFGAINLVTGIAAGAAGVVTAPFDQGALLRSGLRGAVFSLPELFFHNIRKGSFD
jgi:hypothetical protein